MMEYLPNLLLAWGLMSMGFISPGPNIMAVIGTSMAKGRREGLALATGIGCGTGLWAVLTVLGFSSLISQYAYAVLALKVLGCAYLLYLAWGAFSSAMRRYEPEPNAIELASTGLYLRRGLTVQMTNPKAAFYWIAIAAVGVPQGAPLWVPLLLIGVAAALSITVHWLYALAFSTNRAVRLYTASRRPVQAGIGAFFVFASYKLATSKV
ncbi:LysE family translocator [Sulfitobacter aestuariivivens]|uniref:LysE family translocator n=1 Tax=Sulfitobacter aestuariivivens TaxID=2766981 RepID=A0A927D725_9RHOB|nr:LysE family translocator [Sulfitobacter aestuariivivens]MBD3663976.1 LysE family translocator [Sulfitobacter aestuariivivens]